jgi:7,8-dihydro-6-hydroxymethylpterin dimethyltransferase
MPMQSAQTESLCPHCLRRIAARRIVVDDSVYLEKSCPEHGDLERILIWRNNPWPYETWNRTKAESNPPDSDHMIYDPAPMGCPFECGLCRNHRQVTCTAILEVTPRCELGCPVCFNASEPGAASNPELRQIEQMLQEIRDAAGTCPIQLSGGEPTLRDDLPEIVALARKCGFDHIQVNTNGIRLAKDADFARALKDAGITDFFLQFDGITDEVYARTRGTAMLALKLKAIDRCAGLKIGIILVPTLVRKVNESQIGAIIQFAKKWIPTIKGVHFQPMTYLGRYPNPPRNEDRILIPEILAAIEEQTEGELRIENMAPPG